MLRPELIAETRTCCKVDWVGGQQTIWRLPLRSQQHEVAELSYRVHRLDIRRAAESVDVERHPLLPSL